MFSNLLSVEVFEQLEERFNATHDDILLKIDSPNDAMTILKTNGVLQHIPLIKYPGISLQNPRFAHAHTFEHFHYNMPLCVLKYQLFVTFIPLCYFSLFMDSNILADVSDYEGLKSIKPAYVDILEGLEFVPTEGTYGVPYVANAAGVLYNREMFKKHGWEIPET